MLTRQEQRAVLPLAMIFAFRMLGLFMILPVFTPYAQQLSGSTPTLIGLALGIYGLSQACLQIPFGTLSDRYGRKLIITIGLILFAIGSVVAAMAHSIVIVIIGRALQGAGAVGSTLMATVSDVTREENRTKAMAIIGLTIGVSFALAMVLGPLLNHWINVNGIFWLTALLALCGILLLHTAVPTTTHFSQHYDTSTLPNLIRQVIANPELLRLNFGIFAQHAMLTACFVVLPLQLQQINNFAPQHQWLLYLPVLSIAFILMLPFIIMAEKKNQIKPVFLAGIVALGIGQWFLAQQPTFWGLAASLLLFFTGFNLLEALLPSLISKLAPINSKGTALGVYSSSQFCGIFCGGTLGGWLYGHYSISSVFYVGVFIATSWFIIASTMAQPPQLKTYIYHVGDMDPAKARELSEKLKKVCGVADASISCVEGTAYLKVDKHNFNESELKQILF